MDKIPSFSEMGANCLVMGQKDSIHRRFTYFFSLCFNYIYFYCTMSKTFKKSLINQMSSYQTTKIKILIVLYQELVILEIYVIGYKVHSSYLITIFFFIDLHFLSTILLLWLHFSLFLQIKQDDVLELPYKSCSSGLLNYKKHSPLYRNKMVCIHTCLQN